MLFLLLAALALPASAQDIVLPGLERPVEILRDKWGIAHIYAQTSNDLFFAQGYTAARDRLFQIDLWRRIGTGKSAEVLGPEAIARDRFARLIKFRGDWKAEWESYAPDARAIATAFTAGINAYIKSLNGKRPVEFRLAGYDPGLWEPEDVVARIAGLLMIRNVTREVQRAEDIVRFGLDTVQTYLPPDPPVKIEVPRGVDLRGITTALLKDYNEAIGDIRFPELQGSNNWVVSGERSVTGKPLLANDPHRPIKIPSLRKTVHLVGPGWNVIGAGEPALPGIALGHNEDIAFGFTIVGIDQGDLYVEKLNPVNPDQYEYQGQWRNMKVVREEIKVRGWKNPRTVELRYTMHGPVIAEDLGRHRAYALKWAGSEPGAAGYLPALSLSRARNWQEFFNATRRYKIPSENLVYADRAGNIGWIASGLSPIRKNWTGLLPVPGHTGEYEWSGFLPLDDHPHLYNPPGQFIATANHNILPADYKNQLGYEWAPGFRIGRIREMFEERLKFSREDFQRMQQDTHSHAARIFQVALRSWLPRRSQLTDQEYELYMRVRDWDTNMTTDSIEATIFVLWTSKLPALTFGPKLGARTDLVMLLETNIRKLRQDHLLTAFREALADLRTRLGPDPKNWQWGRLHQVRFTHPLPNKEFHRGPYPRPGDGNTVNNTSGTRFQQNHGASYRQIIDVADWDKSVMTNVPGESGDPASPHYDNLLDEWRNGGYHPMLYSRGAVEANTVERLRLAPAGAPASLANLAETAQNAKRR